MNQHIPRLALLLATLALLVPACAGDGQPNNIERCVPGLVAFCACPGGALGTQTCEPDGFYAACVCDGAPADTGAGDTTDSDVDDADTGTEADAGDDTTPTEDATGDATDAPTINLAIGAACTTDAQCASGMCETFLGGAACTEPCLGVCDGAPDDWVCFNRLCTPPDHCDLDAGEQGTGPGCADARCGGCPEYSDCTEFEFGRYECVCREGTILSDDFTECVDVDECEEGTATCPDNTFCVNVPQTWECACSDGWWGPECAACPGGADNPCFGRGVCSDGSEGDGSCACQPRYSGEECEIECVDGDPILCDDADYTGADLSDKDLTDGSFVRADFTDADLSGATLTGATAEGATFDGADLTEAALQTAGCADASFAGATLTDAVAYNANFRRADFTSAVMDGFNGAGAIFAEAKLPGANLAGANLATANMGDTDLTNATLTDAIMSSVVLANADLTGADLSRANLSDAVLSDANFTDANLTDAVLTGAVISRAVWTNATCVDGTNANDNGEPATCVGHF